MLGSDVMVDRTVQVRRPVRTRLSMRTREALTGYALIAPAVLGFSLFTIGPILASLVLSFTNYNILSPPRWIGLANYRTMVADPLFWQSLKVTAIAVGVSLPLQLILGVGLALLLNQKIPALAFWRTVYYLPSVVSGVAVAVLWIWILNPQFGIVNLVLRAVGINGPNWLGNPNTALPALIVISLWAVGGNVVIYLAGLQGIPTELYEAAAIDGANAWRKVRHVTLPMLSPVIFFNLVLGLIFQFQWFTEPYVMTSGGPNNSTLTYMLYLYRNAFIFFKLGYACALAWVLFMVVLALTLIVFRTSQMWVYYAGEKRQ